ncbi:hypothetical protein [Pelosinus baikalensis]|uniref:hypothetical protein n=1 Tax=Pelosinus baikalensis TaxID=2892015 RepID=UPI001E3340EC|nr:hypothetical protein [Pelosinus baikalensis]
MNGDKPFRYISDTPFVYDVQKRIPAVEKAKKLLGFEAKSDLNDMLDEVIPWIQKQVKAGNI